MGKAVVVGAGYAGLAAAFELQSKLPESEEVVLVAAGDDFIFYPSLIWVVQGERELADISFPIRPAVAGAGVTFISSRMESLDAEGKAIILENGQTIPYTKLLIATGGAWKWGTIPGLSPKPVGHTVSMLSPWQAVQARMYWQELLNDPGPVVIGLALGASLYGAAYEFALNIDVALREAGLREKVPLTFVTPEPYLGHFGLDGLGNSRHLIEEAFVKHDIGYIAEAQIERIEADEVLVGNRQQNIRSKFTMIVPPYKGIDPLEAIPDLVDEDTRIPVDDYYRSANYPDVFAAGAAIQLRPNVTTLLPCGVFMPGTVSAEMGRLAAVNLAADLGFGAHEKKSPADLRSLYVMDSGGRGLFLSFGSQSWLNVQLNIPGPWAHWAKVVTEKYQMWRLQTGKF